MYVKIVEAFSVPSRMSSTSLFELSLVDTSISSCSCKRDIVGNTVSVNMAAAEKRLEVLSEATIRDAESWDWGEGE